MSVQVNAFDTFPIQSDPKQGNALLSLLFDISVELSGTETG
jgi:hypothetical protein